MEHIFIAMMTLSVLLFTLGGTGFKWMRRYILPVLLGIGTFFCGVSWWQSLILIIGIGIVYHLPYGEALTFLGKLVVGFLYVIPTLAIGLSWWVLIFPFIFVALFLLSEATETAKSFTWKVCEGFIGLCSCATIIGSILNKWGA